MYHSHLVFYLVSEVHLCGKEEGVSKTYERQHFKSLADTDFIYLFPLIRFMFKIFLLNFPHVIEHVSIYYSTV